MKKASRSIVTVAALLSVLVLSNLVGPSAKAEAKGGCVVDTVVPNEILVVWDPRNDKHPARDFVEGLKEIAKSYRITRTEAINRHVGMGSAAGSATEALLVYVEPKK